MELPQLRTLLGHSSRQWRDQCGIAAVLLALAAAGVGLAEAEFGETLRTAVDAAESLQLHTLVTTPAETFLREQTTGLQISPGVGAATWLVGGVLIWFTSGRLAGLVAYAAWAAATVYVVAGWAPQPGATLAAALTALLLFLVRLHRWLALVIAGVGIAGALVGATVG